MQFKIYDIISRLIPGVFIFSVVGFFSIPFWVKDPEIKEAIIVLKDFNGIITIACLVLAYMTGYVLDGMGSWSKQLFWKLWGGRPSYVLYKKHFKDVPFSEKQKKYT